MSKRFFVAFVALAALCFGAVVAYSQQAATPVKPSADDPARPFFERAAALAEKGDAARAIDGLKGVIALYPESPYAKKATDLLTRLAGGAKSAAAPLSGPAPAGMVRLPGGTFLMGCSPGDAECLDSEKPAHQATVRAFSMDATLVTQAQYQRAMGTNPNRFSDCADCPVHHVNWDEAQAYCAKLGKRLPTEAEYEFAARGGKTAARYGDLDAIAWHGENAGDKIHPVGQKQPNAYGLYDILGDVWEWCADWYSEQYDSSSPVDNPKGPSAGKYRVLRGGSWRTFPRAVRASVRTGLQSGTRDADDGFRCVQD